MYRATVHTGKNQYRELSARTRGKYRLSTEALRCEEWNPNKLKDTQGEDNGIIGRS